MMYNIDNRAGLPRKCAVALEIDTFVHPSLYV